MHRLVIAAGCGSVALLAAACGSSASNATASSTQSSSTGSAGGGRGAAPNGARGEVVKIAGTSLILNTTNGDVTVDYTSATTVLRTSTAALADIAPGQCVLASGRKDASGQAAITSVTLADAVNGACTTAFGQGRGGGPGTSPGASGAPTPDPSRSARPAANFVAVRGMVRSVTGTSVTITPVAGGADQTVTVPTTVTVSKIATAAVTDVAVGDCVAATGGKDSTGTVTARALSITPSGPTGCFTGARGGFGGFGGGGAFGGGGGGAGGGGTATAAIG